MIELTKMYPNYTDTFNLQIAAYKCAEQYCRHITKQILFTHAHVEVTTLYLIILNNLNLEKYILYSIWNMLCSPKILV